MELEASVEEVLNAAVELIDITSQETELLRAYRPADIAPLMEEKVRAAQFYQDLLKKVERRRDAFADLPDRRKEEVGAVGDWVKLIVGENARLLRACADANERLLLAIKEAAEESSGHRVATYGRNGAVAPPPRIGQPVSVSLGVDHRS